MSRCSSRCVALLLGLCFFAQVLQAGRPVIEADLIYREVEGHLPLRLDVYHLSGTPAKPRPAVIFIHGGAWQWGDKQPCRLEGLCEHGYVVVSITYRFSSEAPFPAMLEDCRAAVRWVRENAETYHIDPDRIGVVGVTAGGHLAALLGTTADREGGGEAAAQEKVQAVLIFSAPTDLLGFQAVVEEDPDRFRRNSKGELPTVAVEKLLGGTLKEKAELAAAASPVTHVSAEDPPFFIAHATGDPLVPVEQALALHAALSEVGVDAALRVWSGSGHGVISGEVAHEAKEFLDRILQP